MAVWNGGWEWGRSTLKDRINILRVKSSIASKLYSEFKKIRKLSSHCIFQIIKIRYVQASHNKYVKQHMGWGRFYVCTSAVWYSAKNKNGFLFISAMFKISRDWSTSWQYGKVHFAWQLTFHTSDSGISDTMPAGKIKAWFSNYLSCVEASGQESLLKRALQVKLLGDRTRAWRWFFKHWAGCKHVTGEGKMPVIGLK